MELIESLKKLADRFSAMKESIHTEEATKHSMIMPFLQVLGYDVFDPAVIVPEFTADVGTKKGEKVDYAIMHEGIPMVIIEVKKVGESLDKHSSQLYRYFGTTNGKFAMLTNGMEYRFYSDMNAENKLDDSPFLVVDMENLNSRDVKGLEKFAKDQLNVDSIIELAHKRKYVLEVKDIFREESSNPSEELAKFFASKAMPGTRMIPKIVEDFKYYTKIALSEIITDLAASKINSIKAGLSADLSDSNDNNIDTPEVNDDGIITTQEEIDGFAIIKAILVESMEVDDIAARDTKSYFGILYKDNNRKWICRLYFNSRNKYLGLHVAEKEEEKIALDKIEDIYKHKEKLMDVAKRFIEE